MEATIYGLKAKVEEKIKSAKEMRTTYWVGVAAGLEDILKDIELVIEAEQKYKLP